MDGHNCEWICRLRDVSHFCHEHYASVCRFDPPARSIEVFPRSRSCNAHVSSALDTTFPKPLANIHQASSRILHEPDSDMLSAYVADSQSPRSVATVGVDHIRADENERIRRYKHIGIDKTNRVRTHNSLSDSALEARMIQPIVWMHV